jgi:4-hydroxy-3-methylbut-2-enyl diphosphate reductase
MGVRRAVELARAEAARAAGKLVPAVYTFGPLIHNPQALAELESRGVSILHENNLPQDLAGAVVIIRAHGVSPQTETEIQKRGGRVVDATCPKVRASQLKAKAFADAGYSLFLAGEARHAEIAGLLGYAQSGRSLRQGDNARAAGAGCAVVGNAAEAEAAAAALYAAQPEARAALIGQTTISQEEYRAIGGALQKYFPALEIAQTICAATKDRQDALRGLLGEVDAIIVAGGKESSNTRRLLAIAQESGKPCVLAENAACIPPDFYAFKTIGLCAGASTPDLVIKEIEDSLAAAAF